MTAFLAAAARPFLYLIIWGIAAGAAWYLWRFLPDGKVKEFLYRKRGH